MQQDEGHTEYEGCHQTTPLVWRTSGEPEQQSHTADEYQSASAFKAFSEHLIEKRQALAPGASTATIDAAKRLSDHKADQRVEQFNTLHALVSHLNTAVCTVPPRAVKDANGYVTETARQREWITKTQGHITMASQITRLLLADFRRINGRDASPPRILKNAKLTIDLVFKCVLDLIEAPGAGPNEDNDSVDKRIILLASQASAEEHRDSRSVSHASSTRFRFKAAELEANVLMRILETAALNTLASKIISPDALAPLVFQIMLAIGQLSSIVITKSEFQRTTHVWMARAKRLKINLKQIAHDITTLREIGSVTQELLRADRALHKADVVNDYKRLGKTALDRVMHLLQHKIRYGETTDGEGVSLGTLLGRKSRNPIPSSSICVFFRLSRLSEAVARLLINAKKEDGVAVGDTLKSDRSLTSLRCYGSKEVDAFKFHGLLNLCLRSIMRAASLPSMTGALSAATTIGARLLADASIRDARAQQVQGSASEDSDHDEIEAVDNCADRPLQDRVLPNTHQLVNPQGAPIVSKVAFDDTASSSGTSSTTLEDPIPSNGRVSPGMRLVLKPSPPNSPVKRKADHAVCNELSPRKLIYKPVTTSEFTLALVTQQPVCLFTPNGIYAHVIGNRLKESMLNLPSCKSLGSKAAAPEPYAAPQDSLSMRQSDEQADHRGTPTVSHGQLLVAVTTMAGSGTLYENEPNPVAMSVLDHWIDGIYKTCNRRQAKIHAKNANKVFGALALKNLTTPQVNAARCTGTTTFASVEMSLTDFSAMAAAATATANRLIADHECRQARMQNSMCQSKHNGKRMRPRRRKRRQARKQSAHKTKYPGAPSR